MTTKNPARRRFINITAAYSGAFLLGAASLPRLSKAALNHITHKWNGIALGADASLQIIHPDQKFASQLIDACIAEVRRLESLFSLYLDNSSICTLNRQGYLDYPANDIITLLNRSKEFSRLTNGMFDITVQPLWQTWVNHLKQDSSVNENAMPANMARTLALVDWREVSVNAEQIQLMKPNMAITLNGIAQGYITDRVSQVLANNGIDHALINMGEINGINPRVSRPWQVGIENATKTGEIIASVPIKNQAIATSGAYGTPLSENLVHNHLINPHNGKSSHRYKSVSVVAADATTADALSTAFSLMSEVEIKNISKKLNVQTYIQSHETKDLIALTH